MLDKVVWMCYTLSSAMLWKTHYKSWRKIKLLREEDSHE